MNLHQTFFFNYSRYMFSFPGGTVVKIHLPVQEMQQTWVQSLGQADPLEKGMATHSSILAWKNSMDRGAWRATVHGVTKSQTWLNDWTLTHATKENGHDNCGPVYTQGKIWRRILNWSHHGKNKDLICIAQTASMNLKDQSVVVRLFEEISDYTFTSILRTKH